MWQNTASPGRGSFNLRGSFCFDNAPERWRKFERTLIGEDGQLTQAAKALVRSLARETSVLPIQGPPGSGKTFTGGRMIVELVSQGRRVGVTAASHKVISTLLREVCSAAKQSGVRVRMIQKASEGDECDDASVIKAESNEAVLDALTKGSAKVAAGSAWLWAREEMANSVDVLFVDEAGQMSLANVLAASPSATSIVLLGDPQQLDQPQKGVHPPGADVSALGHLLNGRATIADDQGIFLTETRRLHPDVCAFTSELFTKVGSWHAQKMLSSGSTRAIRLAEQGCDLPPCALWEPERVAGRSGEGCGCGRRLC